MTPEIATAIVIALGGASLVPKIIEGFQAWHSGKAREEKQQNRNALGRLVVAERERDDEAAYRRRVEEHASTLRRMLLELGVPEGKLPEWPARQRTVKL